MGEVGSAIVKKPPSLPKSTHVLAICSSEKLTAFVTLNGLPRIISYWSNLG